MTRILLSSVAAAAVLASAPAAWAQTEIQFWHAMGGNLGESVNALAEGFNKSQSEYKVVPVYKGSYTETLTAAIAFLAISPSSGQVVGGLSGSRPALVISSLLR